MPARARRVRTKAEPRTRVRKTAEAEAVSPAEAAAVRTDRYVSKQAERGLVQVKLWIPADKRDQLIRYAEKIRG